MSIFMQEGVPKVFIAHGLADEQLPIATSGRVNAASLKAAGHRRWESDIDYARDIQYAEVIVAQQDAKTGAGGVAMADTPDSGTQTVAGVEGRSIDAGR
jgi:hypothetical protein